MAVYPALPDGELVYAVGDVHGRADLLARLLTQIQADAIGETVATKRLVFLGDYVDRGAESAGVVEMLLTQIPVGFTADFLKGNHEGLLLDFLAEAWRLEHWRRNGGEATMLSYGVDIDTLHDLGGGSETWQQAFASALPDAHRRFFETLKLSQTYGDYLFVHAGVMPGVPLDGQDEQDLIWIREPFLDWEEPFGRVVVHGHTPVPMPEIRSNRIDIDTGAVFTGRLTALKLNGSSQSFLQT